MTNLFSVLILASSLGIIVTVAMQDGSSEGMGAIGGNSSNASFGSARGSSRQDVLKKITVASAVIFIISALVLAAK